MKVASDKLLSYIEVRLGGMHPFSFLFMIVPSIRRYSNQAIQHPRTRHVGRPVVGDRGIKQAAAGDSVSCGR